MRDDLQEKDRQIHDRELHGFLPAWGNAISSASSSMTPTVCSGQWLQATMVNQGARSHDE
jgi:hypothetical protein